jgi:hypothetical protein
LVEKCGDLRSLIKLQFDHDTGAFITNKGIDKAMAYLLNLENQSLEDGWGRNLLESLDFNLFHQEAHYLGNAEYLPEFLAGPVKYKKNRRNKL